MTQTQAIRGHGTDCGWLPQVILVLQGKEIRSASCPDEINRLYGSKQTARRAADAWAVRMWPGDGMRFKAVQSKFVCHCQP